MLKITWILTDGCPLHKRSMLSTALTYMRLVFLIIALFLPWSIILPSMKLQWPGLLLGASIGGVNGMTEYMAEAMRERASGFGKADKPSWTPEFKDESPPYQDIRIPRQDWTLTCSSSARGYPCKHAIDGKSGTCWRSEASEKGHTFIVDLRAWYQVGAIDNSF